jgi:hypothetical protein
LSRFQKLIGATRSKLLPVSAAAAVPHRLPSAAAVFGALPDHANAAAERLVPNGRQVSSVSSRLRISMRSIGADATTSSAKGHLLRRRAQDVAHHRRSYPRARSGAEIGILCEELGVGLECDARFQDRPTAGRRVVMAFAQRIEQCLAREPGREQARQPAVGAEQRRAGWLAPCRPLWPSLLARMPTR